MLREYIGAIGLFPRKWWFLTTLPQLLVAAFGAVVLLAKSWPADIRTATPWYPSGWTWIWISIASVLVSLAIVQFWAWHEEYQRRKTTEVAYENQLAQAHRDAETRHDIDMGRVSLLETESARLRSMVGRPEVSLRFSEAIPREPVFEGDTMITFGRESELIARNGSDCDALEVYVKPTKVGQFTIHSRIPVDVPSSREERIEYIVSY